MERLNDETTVIDVEYKEIVEPKVQFAGLGDKEVKELLPIMQRFMSGYAHKADDITTEVWLNKQLQQELPEKSASEIADIGKEIINSIDEFDKNLSSLNQACEQGEAKEAWLRDSLQDAAIGVNVNEFGNYLANIDKTLYDANSQMMRVVKTCNNEISQCYNLDGFIAEQQHVNTFNAKAALENKSYYAAVLEPKPGERYGLNSFDVAIKDKANKILHQYQFKFGKDAQTTINLFKKGLYNNQRLVVPAEQLAEVQAALPGKSVSDCIGGTENVSTTSTAMTKSEAKAYQSKVQSNKGINSIDWNYYNTKELALNIGKQAAFAGMGGAALSTGITLAAKAISGEKITTEETVGVALTTGADAGVKAAAAGALKVGVEKGIVPILAKATPIRVIANIACIGIENAKIALQYAKGEISGVQALDRMGRTTTATIGGLCSIGTGAAIGAVALSFIPVAGSLVGGVVGGMVGYVAGSKIGSAIYTGAKKVASVAKSAVKAAWNGVKSVGSAICSGLGKLFSW